MMVEEGVLLARLTSLHVGGPAQYLLRAKNDDDVREAIAFGQQRQLPLFVLGKGSNTLFPDAGWPGVILLMEDRTLTRAGTTVTAGAGVFMRLLAGFALSHGLQGLEELAGIPGTVGGAVRGNAGTWNTEIKDVVQRVDFLDAQEPAGAVHSLSGRECLFAYRDSIFKKKPAWIILRASFQLRVGDRNAGEALVKKDLHERHARQPYDAPSAGSIFKNPPGTSAGALLEQAGMKGRRVGGAEISLLHANWVLNRGGATSSDVVALIEQAQQAVFAHHGVKLEPEIVIVKSV